MPKEEPLWQRMYMNPCYTAVAEMVGYEGVPMDDARLKADVLAQKYGKEAVQKAADAICRHDRETNMLRLTAEARKLCWQLLGVPPEHPEYQHFQDDTPWVPPWNREEPKPEPLEKELARLGPDELKCRLALARNRQAEFSPLSKAGKKAKEEVELILEELKLRGIEAA